MCNLKKNWEKEIDVQNGFFFLFLFFYKFFIFSVHELNSKKDKNVT